MGKKDKGKKKGGGAEKTQTKNDKKAVLKHKKMLEQIGEVMFIKQHKELSKKFKSFIYVFNRRI